MTVVNTHWGLCLFGVRMRRAMQMQIDAMTKSPLEILTDKDEAVRLTVDRSEPQNNAMKPIRWKRADSAEHA
jgi:hypothetical protein